MAMQKLETNNLSSIEILYFSSPGGHLDQLLLLNESVKYTSLLVVDDQIMEDDHVRLSYVTLKPQRRWLIWKNAFMCLTIYLKTKPKIVISTGSGHAIFFFIYARLFGAKTIFIESASRINTLSVTGYIARFIVHRCYVQSEFLKDKAKVSYCGQIQRVEA